MNYPLYKIAANQDFLHGLADGIIAKFFSLCNLNNIIILLPTKNACDSLISIFKEKNIILDNIHSINDLSKLFKFAQKPLDRLRMINKISQQILKMKLENFTSIYAILQLAEYFVDFMHKIETYQLELERIIEIIDEDLAIHKQQISTIFRHLIILWQKNPPLTKVAYSNLLINKLKEKLKENLVILAGINSDIPAIVNLLNCAYTEQNAYIIFAGLDEHLSFNDWQYIDASHSQYNFKLFFAQYNISPGDIKNWCAESAHKASDFVSLALRPAILCSNWHQLTDLDISGIKYLSFNDQHREAKAIIKFILGKQDKNIMIVTADDDLMVKLIFHLKSNNIAANIIRDDPLKQSCTAIWLRLCLNIFLENFSNLSALALFKHPYSQIDITEIELQFRNQDATIFNLIDKDSENDYLAKIATYTLEAASFVTLLDLHLKFASEVACRDIWQANEAQELQTYFKQLVDNISINEAISLEEYGQLFNHFIEGAYYRGPSTSQRITLLKPLDGLLGHADIVILAGLNEGIWPSLPVNNLCFNQNALTKIGLPSRAQAIGIDAYIFQYFASKSEVLLTRSEKIDGNLSLPSRWLLRMLALSRNAIIFNFDHIDPSKQILPMPNQAPIAPLSYRPTSLSVTQIEKLVFNPYHIYVDKILKLKKLPTIIKELSALDFGNFVHLALELYHLNKRSNITEAGKQALKQLKLNQPSIQLLWWPRFLRIAAWFTGHEKLENIIHLECFGKLLINANFTLRAKADRIEILADRSVNIIDYKTGRLPTAKSIQTGKSLQLLLEAVIIAEAGFNWQNSSNKINELLYIELSGGEAPANMLKVDLTDDTIIARTKEYIVRLIEQYQDANMPYYYSRKKIIGYCEYAHLARKH